MNITFRHGHVNDLASIKVKDNALRELQIIIEHWQDDRTAGLLPTETSLRYAHRLATNALCADAGTKTP